MRQYLILALSGFVWCQVGEGNWLSSKACASQFISTCVPLELATRALWRKRPCFPHGRWRKNPWASKRVSYFHSLDTWPALGKHALATVLLQPATKCARACSNTWKTANSSLISEHSIGSWAQGEAEGNLRRGLRASPRSSTLHQAEQPQTGRTLPEVQWNIQREGEESRLHSFSRGTKFPLLPPSLALPCCDLVRL